MYSVASRMFAVIVLFCVIHESLSQGSCPLASKITQCSPKCKTDTDCSLGSICCNNLCNTKSCTVLRAGNDQGYKGSSSSGGSGTYCAGVKCNSFEKCELDRHTKREKCVRS
ncbi:waprin-Phi2-like [Ctenocephalides felis]|uniref:waprin-Phi2-like n=1 Tax=Ctenocephalides felis TaxID=7515 RepID=UPI000E6E24B2|nr:waprin-Phi2-like [Ctenocephalides felis]XP_026467993.1 waprin-Phi2-like [Ctenocephalides felis]